MKGNSGSGVKLGEEKPGKLMQIGRVRGYMVIRSREYSTILREGN